MTQRQHTLYRQWKIPIATMLMGQAYNHKLIQPFLFFSGNKLLFMQCMLLLSQHAVAGSWISGKEESILQQICSCCMLAFNGNTCSMKGWTHKFESHPGEAVYFVKGRRLD